MTRGKPLARYAPLRRSWMRKALPRRVTRPGPGSDPAYLDAVRKLPCYCEGFGCYGDIVAHHAGPKSWDKGAVPLCVKHHAEWHDGNGSFKRWDKAERRAWADYAIRSTQHWVGGALTPEQRAEWDATAQRKDR